MESTEAENERHRRAPKLALSSPSVGDNSYGFNSPPFTRDSSPSPTVSPSPALFSCPPLGRSLSATSYSDLASSVSTISQPSVTSRASSASGALRQRGYIRPQGATFAPSAGNRESVLSLGSIAHLQYYFARTGLLEGKGGRAAKDDRGKPGHGSHGRDGHVKIYDASESGDSAPDSMSETGVSEADIEEPFMLPPTVSTYSHRMNYIAPPPDSKSLRDDLLSSLKEARKALEQVSDQQKESKPNISVQGTPNEEIGTSTSFSQSSGWYEIQGMHILDVLTLAIRAAKLYYTSHEDPHRLYGIKSERKIREELFNMLDVLKKMAGRNFAGGIRAEELALMRNWVDGIDAFIVREQALELQESKERAGWQWLDGDWTGREPERELQFLNSFNLCEPLPLWTAVNESDPKATPLLESLRNGLTLVHLHNALLKKSKRQFGEIKNFHTDTAKPYRCAENLRYWIKAAEIRWETKLKVNVSAVVNGRDEAWLDFNAAILQWSRAVREELSKEWAGAMLPNPMLPVIREHEPASSGAV